MIVSFCESGLKHACSAVQFRGYTVNFRATSCLTKPRIQLVSVTIHMSFNMFHLVICILLSFLIPWTRRRNNKAYSISDAVYNLPLQCFRFPLFSSLGYDTKGRVAMVTWCTSEVLTVTCIRERNAHSRRICLIICHTLLTSLHGFHSHSCCTSFAVLICYYTCLCVYVCDGGCLLMRHNYFGYCPLPEVYLLGLLTFQELFIFLSNKEYCLLVCDAV